MNVSGIFCEMIILQHIQIVDRNNQISKTVVMEYLYIPYILSLIFQYTYYKYL